MLSRYETVLAALDAGVVIHGPDTAILEANDRAREILGLQELDGRLATDPDWVFLESDLTPMALERFPVMQVLNTGKPVLHLMLSVRRPDGADLWVEANALPRLDDDGHIVEIAVTFIDVTVREARTRSLEQHNAQLAGMSITDHLTGLANRRGVFAAADEARSGAMRYAQELAFLLVDLDHFKTVNDRFGHARGDEVLCEAASAIRAAVGAGDAVGRIGGEEFLIVLPATSPSGAYEVAQRVRAAVLDVGSQVGVTASVGIAMFSPPETVDECVSRADIAMYQAKAAGRNTVHVHSPSLAEKV